MGGFFEYWFNFSLFIHPSIHFSDSPRGKISRGLYIFFRSSFLRLLFFNLIGNSPTFIFPVYFSFSGKIDVI